MSRGLLDAIKSLLDDLIAMTQTRVQMLAIDLEEERLRFVALLLSSLAALFLLGLGIVFLSAFVIVAFGSAHPLAVTGVLAAVFLCGGGVVAWLGWRATRGRPRFFSASLSELAKDRARLTMQTWKAD